MYRTGDLARWLPDGNIEFLGRIDYQVKIRGFRIELGEIENCLLSHDQIREVAVIDRTDASGNKYLCAYIVSERELEMTGFKEYLGRELPDYMIPAFFVALEKLPLTANGKVNRKALPEPESNLRKAVDYVAPENEIEKQLLNIWRDILNVEVVGVTDHFFDIGGHSILAMKVVSKAFALGWNLTVQDIFEYPTIREQALKISGGVKEKSMIDSDIELQEQLPEVSDLGRISAQRIRLENVLLTGVTGFLGVHLLTELLTSTSAKIYALVRGKDLLAARERLTKLVEFYFDQEVSKLLDERVIILNGDITLHHFGLTDEAYQELGETVDTILHPAALVKHFGNYADFEKVNVLGTQEIIDFAMTYGIRLNHISTTSVSGTMAKADHELIFTECDFYIGQNYDENVYVRSKFAGESRIIKAMHKGLKATIFRVGNLTGRFLDGQFQANIADNAFYTRIKTMIEIGAINLELLEQSMEFTPIDLCSRAIVQIMQTEEAEGRVFHVYNHKRAEVKQVVNVCQELGIKLQTLNTEEFNQYMAATAEDEVTSELLARMVAYYQPEGDDEYCVPVKVDAKLTIEYLSRIDFEWSEIDAEYITKVIKYMDKVGFIQVK
ncbi:MAG: thioester reductase domain-containing protein [Halanaerobiales bacterium]|nr:thioester reductase domain-containing protein [Halanaerobiales bacterium]